MESLHTRGGLCLLGVVGRVGVVGGVVVVGGVGVVGRVGVVGGVGVSIFLLCLARILLKGVLNLVSLIRQFLHLVRMYCVHITGNLKCF